MNSLELAQFNLYTPAFQVQAREPLSESSTLQFLISTLESRGMASTGHRAGPDSSSRPIVPPSPPIGPPDSSSPLIVPPD